MCADFRVFSLFFCAFNVILKPLFVFLHDIYSIFCIFMFLLFLLLLSLCMRWRGPASNKASLITLVPSSFLLLFLLLHLFLSPLQTRPTSLLSSLISLSFFLHFPYFFSLLFLLFSQSSIISPACSSQHLPGKNSETKGLGKGRLAVLSSPRGRESKGSTMSF